MITVYLLGGPGDNRTVELAGSSEPIVVVLALPRESGDTSDTPIRTAQYRRTRAHKDGLTLYRYEGGAEP